MPESPGPSQCFVRIREATGAIRRIGAGNPRLESEYLMAAALGIPRIELWLRDPQPTDEQLDRFEMLLHRRLAQEPLQYVLGDAEFAGLKLEVGPGVFIPRNETEILVEQVETILLSEGGGCAATPIIVDIGTGSGAVLLSLLSRIPSARGIGIDLSEEALSWARKNALNHQLDERIELRCGDLLAGIDAGSVDVVVSNPPYIALNEADSLAVEIREHEPHEALFGGEDGLDVIRRLVPEAATTLKEGGLLALEIGITQGEAIRSILTCAAWSEIRIRPDLTGRPRVVTARRTRG